MPSRSGSERFQVDFSDRWAKHATLVDTESEFIAYIDTDDVPRADVIATATDIVRILNRHAEEIRTEDKLPAPEKAS